MEARHFSPFAADQLRISRKLERYLESVHDAFAIQRSDGYLPAPMQLVEIRSRETNITLSWAEGSDYAALTTALRNLNRERRPFQRTY